MHYVQLLEFGRHFEDELDDGDDDSQAPALWFRIPDSETWQEALRIDSPLTCVPWAEQPERH